MPRTRFGWLIYVVATGAVFLAVRQSMRWTAPWLPGKTHGPGFIFGLGTVLIYSSVHIVFEYLYLKPLKALPIGQRQPTISLIIGCLLIGALLVYAAYKWPPA